MQKKPYIQRFINKFIWSPASGESRSAENPNIPLSSKNLDQILAAPYQNETGVQVTEESSLTHAAVFRAVRILSDTIASLPVNVIRKSPDGNQVDVDHPLDRLLSKEPNGLMTSFTWRESTQANLSLWGNAYAEIERDNRMRVKALWPVAAHRIEVRATDRNIVYIKDGNVKSPISYQDMVHIPGFGFDGILGKSPIQLAAESMGIGLATQKYGARFYANDATPGGLLTNEGITKTQADASKKAWHDAQSGSNRGKTAVLHGGWKYQQITIPPDQAQFLESRKFSVLDIARWFGVEPHLLFDLERATFSNIEQQSIEFVTYTIRGIVKRWEEELNRKLFTENEKRANQLKVKFNINGLLRGDAKNRADFYRTLSQIGAITPNEVRELENMNKKEGGDKLYMQQSMAPLDVLDEILKGKINK